MARRHGTRAKYCNEGCRCGDCSRPYEEYNHPPSADRRDDPALPYLGPDDGWMDDGECRKRGLPIGFFYPDKNDNEGRADAIAVCWQCDLREKCLEFAVVNRIDVGIWGGTNGRQRRVLIRRRFRGRGRAAVA